MENYYMDTEHEKRLTHLMQEDCTKSGDIERISLFYIIAGNEGLYFKREAIYDFKEHGIRNCMETDCEIFSSGLQSLIRLGFNLYNGYRDKNMTPLELFWNLDSKNRQIAQNAIGLRFIG